MIVLLSDQVWIVAFSTRQAEFLDPEMNFHQLLVGFLWVASSDTLTISLACGLAAVNICKVFMSHATAYTINPTKCSFSVLCFLSACHVPSSVHQHSPCKHSMDIRQHSRDTWRTLDTQRTLSGIGSLYLVYNISSNHDSINVKYEAACFVTLFYNKVGRYILITWQLDFERILKERSVSLLCW